MMGTMFDDLLTANREYQQHFELGELRAPARRGLAVVTCIDSRIEPLAMLGLRPGDAKILRNAGARVTSDVLRSLVLAANFLEVTRICLVQHTDCAMAKSTDDEFRAKLGERGLDASGCEFHAIADPDGTLRDDVALIRNHPLLPDVVVEGFRYDVRTGALHPVPTA
jgi:carbonic anhydrase